MPGSGVVHADPRRYCQTRRQQRRAFLVKARHVLGQQIVDLAGGNSDAHLLQLLQQQWLRDPAVVVLVQKKAD